MDDPEQFVPHHEDRVTVLRSNFDGTRILTASVDHRVKVWDRDPSSGQKSLIETFTAHDADIRDVRVPMAAIPTAHALIICRPSSSAHPQEVTLGQLQPI
jgi:WD40 repeat protein